MYVYEYTKKAILLQILYGILGLILLAMGVHGLINEEMNPFALILGAIILGLLVYMILFTTLLTVRVTSTGVQIICGIGYPKKSFSVEEILNVMQVQNRGFQRYGFNRRIPNGRNFSINNPDAVELQLRNGKKCRIGCDEPEKLLAAIQKVMYPD